MMDKLATQVAKYLAAEAENQTEGQDDKFEPIIPSKSILDLTKDIVDPTPPSPFIYEAIGQYRSRDTHNRDSSWRPINSGR